MICLVYSLHTRRSRAAQRQALPGVRAKNVCVYCVVVVVFVVFVVLFFCFCFFGPVRFVAVCAHVAQVRDRGASDAIRVTHFIVSFQDTAKLHAQSAVFGDAQPGKFGKSIA